jgi:hypothetical protein
VQLPSSSSSSSSTSILILVALSLGARHVDGYLLAAQPAGTRARANLESAARRALQQQGRALSQALLQAPSELVSSMHDDGYLL